VYDDVNQIPVNKVGLVLGTTHKLKSGQDNPYFFARIKTAAMLYHRGKITHIILSGDNRTRYYNEPLQMKTALLAHDVPESAITLDYAGFRTLDSVVRSKEIFGQDSVTIITQRFHTYRALFISDFYAVKAVAIVAGDIPFPGSIPMTLREIAARPLAVIDLYVLKKSPYHLGKKEYLEVGTI
jgi:SanA protein